LPQSPYPDLLRSNSAPTIFEIDEINKLTKSAEAEISDIDDEIARVQCALNRLQSQRTKLRDFVKSHHGVVSIVRRLPSEILGEIFSHYSDASAHSPARLAAVCDRWRAITLASPMLWRHIFPDIRGELSRDLWEMQRIALQLKRSAPAALSIHLNAAEYQLNLN
ncbi:hypothetical protein GGX14DRAFT_375738, partial [Mycena pura]